MSLSNETQQKISRFAKEQAQYYLDEAEMTYIEKLRKKTDRAGQKIGGKLARFRISSDKALEARSDMILYMSDYMIDLMSKGMSEREAFEKAEAELTASRESEFSDGMHERFRKHYEHEDYRGYETAGLLTVGFTIIGMVVGALFGYLSGGGRLGFIAGGWIDTAVYAGVGLLIGSGLGMIAMAVAIGRGRR